MKIKGYLLFVTAVLGLASCSSDLAETVDLGDSAVNKIQVIIAPLNPQGTTRTLLAKDGDDNFSFVWSESDEIGIFPDQGYQTGFSMAGGAGSATAEFTGGGWGLKTSSTYAAYYPFIHDIDLDKTAIAIDYCGQKQTANGSSTHLAAYDFMTAPASAPLDGMVSFNFGHLGTLLHFKFTMPEAAELTSIILKTNGELTEKATLNLISNQVTATTTNTKQTLYLENVSVIANEVLDAYMMIDAVDLTGKTLEATVTSAAGDAYVADLTAQNFVGGDVWNYSRTLAKDAGDTYLGHAYVDLGITDSIGNKVLWATTNVGAENPWEYGGHYAWGETKADGEEDTSNAHNYSYGNTYKKTYYEWCTYKWATGDSWTSISKYSFADDLTNAPWYQAGGTYIGLSGVKDQKKLELEDDAAHVNWGNGWRMPAGEEFNLLRNNCYWKWVTEYYGQTVSGYIVYKAKAEEDKGYLGNNCIASYSASTDAHIFLPVAGYSSFDYSGGAGYSGFYWASELYCASDFAWCLNFNFSSVNASNFINRCDGLSIRPVHTVQN